MEVAKSPVCQHGLTLVELVTTLAIVLVVLGIGIPTWANLAQSNAITTARNHMQGTLMHARMRAIQLNRHVTVCPSRDRKTCKPDHTAWHKGYISFVDVNGNRQRDAGDDLIQVTQPALSGIQIHSSIGRKSIRFGSGGNAWGSNLSLRFCSDSNSKNNKALLVFGTGRARLSKTLSDGSPVTCDS